MFSYYVNRFDSKYITAEKHYQSYWHYHQFCPSHQPLEEHASGSKTDLSYSDLNEIHTTESFQNLTFQDTSKFYQSFRGATLFFMFFKERKLFFFL